MLDVEGFSSSDLKIKLLGNNQLLVEGNSEKKDEKSNSIRTFKRNFFLPGQIQVEKITSFISSDGVLTIVVPRIVSKD